MKKTTFIEKKNERIQGKTKISPQKGEPSIKRDTNYAK